VEKNQHTGGENADHKDGGTIFAPEIKSLVESAIKRASGEEG
jgi:hypothetical protein